MHVRCRSRRGRLLPLVAACAMGGICLCDAPSRAETLPGKIIVFGGGGPTGGCPDTKWFRERVNGWEEVLPVDGVLIATNPKSGVYWADAWLTGKKHDRAEFDEAIENLRAAKPKRYTDNYMRLDVLPADVDWFDEAGWEGVLHNAAISAEVVRDGGLAGIFLDTEQYHQDKALFAYPPTQSDDKRTLAAYQDQAYKRGLELGKVWTRIQPDMHVPMTYGPSHVVIEMGGTANPAHYGRSSMPLLPAFTDGLLASGLNVTDAYERTYFAKRHAEFVAGRRMMKEEARALSRDGATYSELRVGFGLWPTAGEKGFNGRQYWRNRFTPQELEHALSYALEQSDGFVWLYMGDLRVLADPSLWPADYAEAIRRGRQRHDRGFRPRPTIDRAAAREPGEGVIVCEAEDMTPVVVETGRPPAILDRDDGQNWGQSGGKAVMAVRGMYDTGTVRFTFPQAIPDGLYRLEARMQTPIFHYEPHFQWRATTKSGAITPLSKTEGGWTPVQMGQEEKGTKLTYAQWMWFELLGPKQPYRGPVVGWAKLEGVAAGDLTIEIQDDDKATYNLTHWDQFALVRRPDPDSWKVVAFGGWPGTSVGGTPHPTYLLRNLDKFEALPFDGIVFTFAESIGYFSDNILAVREPAKWSDVEAEVKKMRAIPFKQLTHNYLRVDTARVDFDWFDDGAWKIAAERFGIAARAARESGAVGIMLDTEQYTHQPFNYMLQANRVEYSFTEYRHKAMQRGAEAMRAMRTAFPNMHLMLTFGPGETIRRIGESPLHVVGDALLPAFFDGLLAESEGCTVTDAYESTYGARTADEFREARWHVKAEASPLSLDPHRYLERTHVGFGVWPAGAKGLDAEDFLVNNHTPEELEHALCFACEQSDGVVWLYGGGTNWFEAPAQYLDAIRNGRKPHDYQFEPAKRLDDGKQKGYIISARGRADCRDEVVFAALKVKHRELFDFPLVWQFRLDPDEVGEKEKWFAAEPAEREWQPLEIREWWEPQLQKIYFGYAWYRVEFEVQDAWLKDKLLLAFGAVDEQAWVYLNGKPIGSHAFGPEGWNTPFELDIQPHAKPGTNTLVVRVHNSAGVGGIWKGVKLFGEK